MCVEVADRAVVVEFAEQRQHGEHRDEGHDEVDRHRHDEVAVEFEGLGAHRSGDGRDQAGDQRDRERWQDAQADEAAAHGVAAQRADGGEAGVG